jgi:hypothetical protein
MRKVSPSIVSWSIVCLTERGRPIVLAVSTKSAGAFASRLFYAAMPC